MAAAFWSILELALVLDALGTSGQFSSLPSFWSTKKTSNKDNLWAISSKERNEPREKCTSGQRKKHPWPHESSPYLDVLQKS